MFNDLVFKVSECHVVSVSSGKYGYLFLTHVYCKFSYFMSWQSCLPDVVLFSVYCQWRWALQIYNSVLKIEHCCCHCLNTWWYELN